MHGFVCHRCGEHIRDPSLQFAERTEARRIDGKGRAFVVTTAYLCKSCLPARFEEIKEHAGPAEIPTRQVGRSDSSRTIARKSSAVPLGEEDWLWIDGNTVRRREVQERIF